MLIEAAKYHNVTDNVHDIMQLTDFEYRVMNGPLFNRLHYVYQDSTSFFSWPAMRIQRYEHSLGTMHLAGDMFFNSLANADAKTIAGFAELYANAIIALTRRGFVNKLKFKNGGALSMASINELALFVSRCQQSEYDIDKLCAYSFLVPSNIPNTARAVCMCIAQAVRLAGMLHDVGHPPFSHVCERVLTSLYLELESERHDNESIDAFIGHIDSYLDGSSIDVVDLHEQIGSRLAALAVSEAIESSGAIGDERLFMMASAFAALAMLDDYEAFADLHGLVSGTVDADRLDYVQRDSKSSGFGADALQYGRITKAMRLIRGGEGNQYVFALPAKTLPTVEDFLRKRLMNYKTIIFHHRVVKSEELLKAIIKTLSIRYFNNNAKIVQKPNRLNSDLYVLPDNVSGLWQPLANRDGNQPDAVLAFSQWNDSWLLTTLRNEYIRLKVDGCHSDDDQILLYQLAELFYSEKHYETVVKRSGDCRTFRNILHSRIESVRDTFANALDKIDESRSKASNALPKGLASNISGNRVRSVLRDLATCDRSMNILRKIDRNYSVFLMAYPPEEKSTAPRSFTEFFANALNKALDSVNCKRLDLMVTKNHIKPGVGENYTPARFFSEENGTIEAMTELSAVREVLLRETEDVPAFFAYVLVEDDYSARVCHSVKMFECLADIVFELIFDCFANVEKYMVTA